jgi:hypothetical protein
MTYNKSLVNKYPDYAMQNISLLTDDERPVVRRAVKSTINFLSKRHPQIIVKFMKL